MIVSHDRYFLDRVATHTLAFEDDGGVVSRGGKGVFGYFELHPKNVLCFVLRGGSCIVLFWTKSGTMFLTVRCVTIT